MAWLGAIDTPQLESGAGHFDIPEAVPSDNPVAIIAYPINDETEVQDVSAHAYYPIDIHQDGIARLSERKRISPYHSERNTFSFTCPHPQAVVVTELPIRRDGQPEMGRRVILDNPIMGGRELSEWIPKASLYTPNTFYCHNEQVQMQGEICGECTQPNCAVRFVWSRGSWMRPQTIRAECGRYVHSKAKSLASYVSD
jgi:hypothetical protein